MISVVILGSGNVASHLINAFENSKEVDLIQVFARNINSKINIKLNTIVSKYEDIVEADVYIVAVSDAAIAEVVSKIPFKNKLVVHTSGSIELLLENVKNRNGVFYPLQTFTKNKEVNFSKIPICIEAENEIDEEVLHKLASSLSGFVYKIDSNQRKALHVSAVFVCNFVNHLYKIGNDICEENNISFDILKPLILETAEKINVLNPEIAQTGPAVRNDIETIKKQELFLKNNKNLEIYKILTQSIQKNE